MRWAITQGAFLCDFGMFAGSNFVAIGKGHLCEEVVDIGLLEAILAPVGDFEGLTSERLGLFHELCMFAGRLLPLDLGQFQQDVGLEFNEPDPTATREGLVQIRLGASEVAQAVPMPSRLTKMLGISGSRILIPA